MYSDGTLCMCALPCFAVSRRLSVRAPRAVVPVHAAQAAAPWGICAAYQAVGAHCGRDIIQDQWSPCHSVSTILTSIQSLLTDPNCSSPANPEAASLYVQNRGEYNKKVRRCAQRSVE